MGTGFDLDEVIIRDFLGLTPSPQNRTPFELLLFIQEVGQILITEGLGVKNHKKKKKIAAFTLKDSPKK